MHQLEIRWIWAGLRCAPVPLWRAGNSGQGLDCLCPEAVVKVYGVATAMPQGQSRVPNPLIGQQ
jgi:hypothetical protein